MPSQKIALINLNVYPGKGEIVYAHNTFTNAMVIQREIAPASHICVVLL